MTGLLMLFVGELEIGEWFAGGDEAWGMLPMSAGRTAHDGEDALLRARYRGPNGGLGRDTGL